MANYKNVWKEIDKLIPNLKLYITKKKIEKKLQDVAISFFKKKLQNVADAKYSKSKIPAHSKHADTKYADSKDADSESTNPAHSKHADSKDADIKDADTKAQAKSEVEEKNTITSVKTLVNKLILTDKITRLIMTHLNIQLQDSINNKEVAATAAQIKALEEATAAATAAEKKALELEKALEEAAAAQQKALEEAAAAQQKALEEATAAKKKALEEAAATAAEKDAINDGLKNKVELLSTTNRNIIITSIRDNLIHLAKQRFIIEMNKHIRGDKQPPDEKVEEDLTGADVIMTTTFGDEKKTYKIA